MNREPWRGSRDGVVVAAVNVVAKPFPCLGIIEHVVWILLHDMYRGSSITIGLDGTM